MKKLFVILILGFIYTTSSYAQDKTPSSVLNSFQNNFSNAENTAWSSVKDLYRADFTLEDQKASAFFNSDGDFIASSRQVTSLQLPMFLKSGLKNSFHDYDVINLFEVDNENGVTYYATIKNSKKQFMLESISGEWVRYNKDANF
jgi:hypothetical protein